jgi:hypothetical protein
MNVLNTPSLFTDGVSILESIKHNNFPNKLVETSNSTAARKRIKGAVTNEVLVSLDNESAKVNFVPNLKTTLYPHQQTVVKAMLDLEHGRKIEMTNVATRSLYKLAYNVAVLSEPVGSGKTIDVLSLISLSKMPRAIPDIMELPYPKGKSSIGFIRRKFKKILSPTIIFVGTSVMKQWESAIKTFTDLKAFCVNSIVELKTLLNIVANRTVNNYDIILVKNGKITRPIELPYGITLEDKNKVTQAYIYNIIANLRSYCWARVIVDDFDTIKLPHNAGIVNGVFTWYISSTRKKMDFRGCAKNKFNSAKEILQTFDYGCANIMYNNLLFNLLNVRNNIDFLKDTTNVPNPKYHVAIFKNPNNQYISLLAGMGDSDVNRITEMLNGDAIGEAAEAAGIKTSSVATIFEKILGSKFQQYRFAGDLLSFIGHVQESESDRRPMNENPDDDDKYGKRDLLAFREIEYKYPGVNKIIETTEEEYKEVKKVNGIAIDRVKERIKEGTCPVCRIDLEDSDECIIVKCCGAVFCGNCGVKAQRLVDRFNKLNGTCSACRASVTIKDLIYISDNFDLTKIEKEEFEDEETSVNPANIEQVTNKVRTKYTAITDIIYGRKVIEDKRVDMFIPNMMKGGAFLPEPKIRKVLVFANYDETLKNVIKELDDEKIHYWRLMGGINDIDKISGEFTRCKTTCVLVINSTKHCSGLNLQTATDLVFTHSIIDPAIESQVAGRGHRLGRTSPLNIWFMQYDNEFNTLVSTHGVRDLSTDELSLEHDYEKGTDSAAINNIEDNTDDCYLTRSKKTKLMKNPKTKKTKTTKKTTTRNTDTTDTTETSGRRSIKSDKRIYKNEDEEEENDEEDENEEDEEKIIYPKVKDISPVNSKTKKFKIIPSTKVSVKNLVHRYERNAPTVEDVEDVEDDEDDDENEDDYS